jgi:hypothetical protein
VVFSPHITKEDNSKLLKEHIIPTVIKFYLYSKVSNNYKLTITQYGHPFLCIISSSTDSNYNQFAT